MPTGPASDPWTEDEDRLVANDPIALELCAHCHGTGECVCPECFGQGEVQCPACRGVGMDRMYDGTYSSQSKCDVCRGAKKLPCTVCKGVPQRPCEVCRGSGVVGVYPAIAISRTVSEIGETSLPTVSSVDGRFRVPLAVLEGGARSFSQAAARLVDRLVDRFEGAEVLREGLAYSPKDEAARIVRLKAALYWYPYMLCWMKSPRDGKGFVLCINCKCESVFLVGGKCPKGEGIGSAFFGWASDPFDKTAEGEPEFMLKQLKQGEQGGP